MNKTDITTMPQEDKLNRHHVNPITIKAALKHYTAIILYKVTTNAFSSIEYD